MKKNKVVAAVLLLGALGTRMVLAGGDRPTDFLNQGTIANTRHNLTQRPFQNPEGKSIVSAMMEPSRNDYSEVCVYCHTPHASNASIAAAPLWNRTARTTSYMLYNQQSLQGNVAQPGPNSLTCLSCHDGQTAVDSIVNMPGSGGYNPQLALDPSSATSESLLDAWSGNAGDTSIDHQRLNLVKDNTSCLTCHSPGGVFTQATDFTVAAIGTDLSNDHPVGVQLPTGPDWKTPGATFQNIKFFDTDGDGRPGKGELRLYNSGTGFMVECASCHDPHGVPGPSTTFFPTFLRASNDGSALCMSCHVK